MPTVVDRQAGRRVVATLPGGAAWARWPSRSSKPVRCGSPTLGRFDSGAAPLSRFAASPTGLAARRVPDVRRDGDAARDRSEPPRKVADCGANVARSVIGSSSEWVKRAHARAPEGSVTGRSLLHASRRLRRCFRIASRCPSLSPCSSARAAGGAIRSTQASATAVARRSRLRQASREIRKTVTVLFCDVTGSTALGESVDPEALRALLARYFERMKAIVESHGGTVEKFIGDAVMAVFGIPAAHEDDALRACRAAVEMRDALPELGIRGRIGVNTGEVVTGTSERLATGDAVNVAARFEQAAAPGEVLIGEATHALVHDAVVAEPVEPLTLKGKSEPVPAFRLVSVLGAPERSHASRFVGREPELAQIADAWKRAQTEARCELVTVVGDAGVGKSRLVAEALAAVEARVVRGRCLPYGEGITYWPVVEVVKQLAAMPSDPVAAAAIRSLLGESDVGTSGDEIAWAFRKLLEEQAPLVVVFDDIQWGEETFLDLVESTALLSAGAPLLLLCMARPELVERRPGWPGTLRLEPLPAEQADALIGDAVSGELRERIARAAGGNPLFISEMLAMAAGNAEVEVPPTLKALLAARLDQLDERRAQGARARLGRGRDLPSRRRAGARPRGDAGHDPARRARAPRADPPRSRPARRRRRLPLPPPADPRRRLRRPPQGDPCRPARPLRRLARRARPRRSSSATRSSATTSSRPPATGPSSGSPTPLSPSAPPCGSPPPAGARTTASTAGPRSRCSPGRSSSCARTGSTSRSSSRPHGRPARSTVARPRRQRTAVAERAEAAGDHSGAMLARAMALFLRMVSGELGSSDEQEALCRAALPFEEERADPQAARAALVPHRLCRAIPDAERRERRRLRARRSATSASPATPLVRHAGARLGADPRPAPGGRGDADARRARRPAGLPETGTSRGRCCSRCSAASTRRGRSPRHGRITCAR